MLAFVRLWQVLDVIQSLGIKYDGSVVVYLLFIVTTVVS